MLILNYATFIDPWLRDVRKRIPIFSGMKAGDKVIDVCCGTGAQVLEYGHLGIYATGIDIDPGKVRIAESNRIEQKAINVSFQLADATKLPFPNGFFDYASISLGLHDKEKYIRYQIISEMKRVTGKDGDLILIDFQVPLAKNGWSMLARAIEFCVGGTHYRSFQEYITNNGLEEIKNYHGLLEKGRASLLNGLLLALKVGNV